MIKINGIVGNLQYDKERLEKWEIDMIEHFTKMDEDLRLAEEYGVNPRPNDPYNIEEGGYQIHLDMHNALEAIHCIKKEVTEIQERLKRKLGGEEKKNDQQ